jgi:hypothetical protein
MRLLDTMPSFDRLRMELETSKMWKHLSADKQLAIMGITRMCCDRGRAPHHASIGIMPSSGGARWWFSKIRDRFVGCMTLNADGMVDFTTFRPSACGGGWIGENFRSSIDFEHDLTGFFNKIDRIKKEMRCAS